MDLMTTAEVAAYFRVDASTVRRWRLDGVGPRFVKIGRVYRYPRPALDEWIAQRIASTRSGRDTCRFRAANRSHAHVVGVPQAHMERTLVGSVR